MLTTHVTLPTGSSAGERGEWILPLQQRNRETDELPLSDATFLGFGTTQTSRHTGHDGYDHAERGGARCSACRWYETRLFRIHDNHPHHYVLHHLGGSRVPGELQLARYEDAWSAHEVVELFTVRPDPGDRDSQGRVRTPFLTRPGARVLAQAATYDDDIDDAYVNRAVQ